MHKGPQNYTTLDELESHQSVAQCEQMTHAHDSVRLLFLEFEPAKFRWRVQYKQVH
jgi:hypothetical protein